jgi:hypothetical protein
MSARRRSYPAIERRGEKSRETARLVRFISEADGGDERQEETTRDERERERERSSGSAKAVAEKGRRPKSERKREEKEDGEIEREGEERTGRMQRGMDRRG